MKISYQRNALCWLVVKFEREKFYPGPGIQPGPLALRASPLPLRHPGQLPIQGRMEALFKNTKITQNYVFVSYALMELVPSFQFHLRNNVSGDNLYNLISYL